MLPQQKRENSKVPKKCNGFPILHCHHFRQRDINLLRILRALQIRWFHLVDFRPFKSMPILDSTRLAPIYDLTFLTRFSPRKSGTKLFGRSEIFFQYTFYCILPNKTEFESLIRSNSSDVSRLILIG